MLDELIEYYRQQFPNMSEQDLIQMAEQDMEYEEGN
jgi:hypothetical protein